MKDNPKEDRTKAPTPEKIKVPEYVIRELHRETYSGVPYEVFCSILEECGICCIVPDDDV